MVQQDVALRKDVKLESLKDGREIRLCMDGSWLPFFVLKSKTPKKHGVIPSGETVYVHKQESFDELWEAIKILGDNNIERNIKAQGIESRRMKAQRERNKKAHRAHKLAVKKSQQYSGFLFKAMFNRMRVSSGSRVPWLDFIEDLLVDAKRDWFNGKFSSGEWVHHYLGEPQEDFRFDKDS